MNLTGKHILVTGGSRGIGRAVAQALSAEGAQVSIWSRSTFWEEQSEGLKGVKHFACDVSDRHAVGRALAETLDASGPLTGCIANAGVRPRAGTGVIPEESDCYRTNVLGTQSTLQAVVKSMIEFKVSDGRLLAIGSLAGGSGATGHTTYAMSKAALIPLIKGLAREVASHGITANLLIPGWIETSMNQDVIENRLQYESIKRVRIPMKRWGQPEDLAGICIYLMSSLSRYHTGDTITVDGGYRLF